MSDCTPTPIADCIPVDLPAVTSFDPNAFREVGAVAEFDPEMCTGKSKGLLHLPVRVIKVNPRTVKVETPDGRVITTDAWCLVPTDREFVSAPVAPTVRGLLVRVGVRLSAGRSGPVPADALFVVVSKVDLSGKVEVARLGGDGGRYYTVPAASLTVVPPAEVLA